VKQYLANRRVEWEFVVEKAPWWGGGILGEASKKC